MVDIKGTTITITKGDSARIAIKICNMDGTKYTPSSEDTIRFAMKKDYNDAEPILVKTIPVDTMMLSIDPEDTKNLKAGQKDGRYKYGIELRKPGNIVDTFIPRADFIILEEVL